jgi:hypothetical protein
LVPGAYLPVGDERREAAGNRKKGMTEEETAAPLPSMLRSFDAEFSYINPVDQDMMVCSDLCDSGKIFQNRSEPELLNRWLHVKNGLSCLDCGRSRRYEA